MNQAWRMLREYQALPYIFAQIGLRRPRVQVEQQVVPAGAARMVVMRPLVVHRPRSSFVFFVHGGNWNSGNPSYFRFVGHWFAERGFTTFLAGYRLAPEHTFPAQVDDVRAAMAVCQEMRPDLGLEDKRVVLGGQSAGAHLAAYLLYKDREEAGLDIAEVAGFFSISGPVDLERCTQPAIRRYVDAFAGERAAEANPFPYIRGDEGPAVLAIHGERDAIVDLACSEALAERSGGLLHVVEGAGHNDLSRIFLQAREETRVLEHWLDDVDAG